MIVSPARPFPLLCEFSQSIPIIPFNPFDWFILPVYPIVIFSYNEPHRPEPMKYEVAFPGKTVLQFHYTVIQLNRLSWRQFVHQPNPIAAALMAKMKIAPKDRPKVKLQCLRLLATLKLDATKSKMIGGFIDSYLKLTAEELKQYEREFARLTPQEQEETMELITSWEQKGIDMGRQQGKEELVARLIRRRFGAVSPQLLGRLDQLSSEQLNELGEALFDFADTAALETWLSRHPSQ